MAADITVTAAKVGLVDPLKATVKSYIAAATITKGQAVYITTAGKVNLADDNGSGTLQFRGIALNGGGAGQAIDVCEDGELYGFTLTAVAYDGIAYLSQTAGALYDTAVGHNIVCGRAAPMSDKDLTKVLRVFVRREADWS